MCIFCGGTCGGVGDSLLPFAAAGIPLVIMKIRSKLITRKSQADNKPSVSKRTKKDIQRRD